MKKLYIYQEFLDLAKYNIFRNNSHYVRVRRQALRLLCNSLCDRRKSKLETRDIELQQATSVCGKSSQKQPNIESNTDNIAFQRNFVVSGRLALSRAFCQ